MLSKLTMCVLFSNDDKILIYEINVCHLIEMILASILDKE